jgi:hypothetical protein
MMNATQLKILPFAVGSFEPGQWIEEGTLIGFSPDRIHVRSPLTGVIKEIYPSGNFLHVVIERRMEYDEMDD